MALITPTDSYHYINTWPNCPGWTNCTPGTIKDHYHTLYAWMTGGGPPGASYTPVPTPETCIYQVSIADLQHCSSKSSIAAA